MSIQERVLSIIVGDKIRKNSSYAKKIGLKIVEKKKEGRKNDEARRWNKRQ